MKKAAFAAACVAATLITAAHASCGAAFCLVNTDWSSQGGAFEPGFMLDLKFESVDLDQPRTGTDRIAVGQVTRHHDEVETRNRNWVLAADWSPSPTWGLSLSLPFVDREHLHVHNHRGEKVPETWSFREVGDARVTGRYELFGSRERVEHQATTGVTFGVKLPTGSHDVANAQGALAERTLQPGTGTTDLLLGFYSHGVAPLAGVSWFARVQATLPTDERDAYKPGNAVNVDGGVRYAAGRDVGLMLQLNYVHKARDKGAEAEPEDSGQAQVFVSPGLSWNAARSVQLYAFAQFPLYQKVNGVQLTADWSALAGVSWRF